jgi:hypothetical protein
MRPFLPTSDPHRVACKTLRTARWSLPARKYHQRISACSGKVDADFPKRTCATEKEVERNPFHSNGMRSQCAKVPAAADGPFFDGRRLHMV